jgi:hypothetical protein
MRIYFVIEKANAVIFGNAFFGPYISLMDQYDFRRAELTLSSLLCATIQMFFEQRAKATAAHGRRREGADGAYF